MNSPLVEHPKPCWFDNQSPTPIRTSTSKHSPLQGNQPVQLNLLVICQLHMPPYPRNCTLVRLYSYLSVSHDPTDTLNVLVSHLYSWSCS